ncbi:DNA-directed RNA polymerase III subunit RPC10, partial [Capronia epimyces CBS 606.96]
SLTIARAPGTRQHPQGLNAFTCRTCPYQFVLDQQYYERTYMKKKQLDDIMGEEQSDLPTVEGCPKEECDSKLASFYQLQTRSADEPPTSFYRVCPLSCAT